MKDLRSCLSALCVAGPMTLLVVALILGSLFDKPSSH